MSIDKEHEIIFIIYTEYDMYAMNNKSAEYHAVILCSSFAVDVTVKYSRVCLM
jgi:hypothetical protein